MLAPKFHTHTKRNKQTFLTYVNTQYDIVILPFDNHASCLIEVEFDNMSICAFITFCGRNRRHAIALDATM
jgi:hypothetical protein